MMTWMNLNFQNPNSTNMFKLTMFHNLMMIMIINIMIFLILMINFNLKNKFNYKILIQNQKMEMFWTMIPMLIIIKINLISINLMFINNEMKKNMINLKIISNQWFWNYEYPNFNINFNSYLIINNNFNFFMIETDNNLIMPFNYQMMMIMSSMDVIHSWTIPSINIKMDCIPNQINSTIMMINKPNIMFGQCSEICGINHSFMPIKIESINMKNFMKWIN